MRFIKECRFVDAIAAWGKLEAIGRAGWDAKKLDGSDGLIRAIDFALFYRSRLLSQLLSGRPVSVHKVEIEPADSSTLILSNRKNTEQWKASVRDNNQESFVYYRSLAKSKKPVEGPLICTAQIGGSNGYVDPIIVFDGWHRLAAWTQQLRRTDYPISAYLILTKD